MTRSAFTLVELLVTLALMAILLALVPLTGRIGQPGAADWRAEITSARRRAIRKGIPISARTDSVGRYTVTPDGYVAADSVPVALLEIRP